MDELLKYCTDPQLALTVESKCDIETVFLVMNKLVYNASPKSTIVLHPLTY